MGVRSGAALALVAVALLGFTVAVPQDTRLGVTSSGFHFTGKGANVGDAQLVHGLDGDVGSLLDRLDGANLDPDMLRNMDPQALADLLSRMSPEQLATLGLTPEQAAGMIASLRDPSLDLESLAGLVGLLAGRGLSFVNANGDGRFNDGEQAYADLDGDGKVSEGDVRLGALAVLAAQDRGLDPEARDLLSKFEKAGAIGLNSPRGATSRGNATAATSPMEKPLSYPSDRGGGPVAPVCVQVYSPALTCHTRTFVQQAIQEPNGFYLFKPDLTATRTPIPLEPEAVGPRARGTLHLTLDPGLWTPVPTVTPGDRLVSIAGPSIALARDANGMVWARGPVGPAVFDITWAVDMAYYDLDVPGSVTARDVPTGMQPLLEAQTQAVGMRITALAGAADRGYGGGLRALATHIRAFGVGALPDRDQRADDLLAVAESQVGCARQRSEVFALGAQSLGIPTRLVINEAHAFAEAWIPQQGWRMVDLGGCGKYQVATRAGHEEVIAQQDLPFASGQAPASQVPKGARASTTIDITESPSSLRKNVPFTIAGTVRSPAGPVPAGIPITFTYNRTKQSAGTAFCSATTTEGGYRATCQLGQDTPAGSLQLVARLAPATIAGQPSDLSYSDPPFNVQKATRLAIEGPRRAPADVQTGYVVQLSDDDGLPVAYAPVTLRLGTGATQDQDTDRAGRAAFTLRPAKGTHTVEARFAGDAGHDASNATTSIQAVPSRLTARIDQATLQGGELRVTGTAAPGQAVLGKWTQDDRGESHEVRAAGDGSFTVAFDGAPKEGLGFATFTTPSDGVGVGVGFTRTFDAVATLEVPARWQAGAAVPVAIQLRDSPTDLHVTVLADGEPAARTVATLAGTDATARTVVLVDLAPGPHTLTLQAEPGVRLAANAQQVRVGQVEAQVDPIPVQAAGGRIELAGTLFFEGQPVADELSLRLLDARATGRSGPDGRFHITFVLPAEVPVGRAGAILEAPGLGLQQDVELRIQRPARLSIESPSLSFHAFGSTPVVVRGEGLVHVRVGGQTLQAGILDIASSTLLLRVLRIDAVAMPANGSDDGIAPASKSLEIVVVNPVTLVGAPLAAVLGTTTALRLGRRKRAAKAHRHRFLPRPARLRARVLHPPLPDCVPRVLDPALDELLQVRVRRKGTWQVRDGRGRLVPASVDGRVITVPLRGLAPGLHQLRLERHEGARHAILVPCAIQSLRSALDDATRRLAKQLADVEGAVTMEGLEASLVAAGATPDHAQAVRATAEAGLYAGPRCDRAAFHAFFEALDRAQAGA
ncbi:MAG TPA: transglutaminase domain-containing protein [Candidatus Thermoplasmatota archaeon]|nr:transglutaminase domain-containing protein [Candidatus Thermoplasmatota archaeon]